MRDKGYLSAMLNLARRPEAAECSTTEIADALVQTNGLVNKAKRLLVN